MVYFGFFCSSIATPVPPPLLCMNCLTYLLKLFWAIHQTPTKKPWWSFFGKVVGLQHTDFLKWNTLFSEIAIIWNNWDKILSEFFDNFSTNGLHIVIGVIVRNGKIFHLLYIFLSPRLSYALFVYLIFHYTIS